MTRYTGNHCPVCEQAFTDEDDIVVCPDCGTPYHRACWQKVGACMHKSEHAAGFEWQPEFGPEAEKAAHEATCPNCGTHNQPGAAQCSHCGCPLPKDDGPRPDPKDEDTQVPIYARDPSTVHKPDNSRTTPGPRIDTYTADDNGGICRREIGPEDTIDGIKAKDWAAYVGRSPMYYLMQFFRMSMTKQKVTVCLSAFLFGPAYLLYRKMWKEGLLTALLSLVLSVPSLIAIVATFNPSLFGSMPLHWVPVAADVCAIADWIVRICWGFSRSGCTATPQRKILIKSTANTPRATPAPMPCCKRAAPASGRRCSTLASYCCSPRWSSIWPGLALFSTPWPWPDINLLPHPNAGCLI